MDLINNHDHPLGYQFIMEISDQFVWEYLEEGPDVARINRQEVKLTHSGKVPLSEESRAFLLVIVVIVVIVVIADLALSGQVPVGLILALDL